MLFVILRVAVFSLEFLAVVLLINDLWLFTFAVVVFVVAI